MNSKEQALERIKKLKNDVWCHQCDGDKIDFNSMAVELHAIFQLVEKLELGSTNRCQMRQFPEKGNGGPSNPQCTLNEYHSPKDHIFDPENNWSEHMGNHGWCLYCEGEVH